MQILEPQQFATWNEPIDMLYACHSKVKRLLQATYDSSWLLRKKWRESSRIK